MEVVCDNNLAFSVDKSKNTAEPKIFAQHTYQLEATQVMSGICKSSQKTLKYYAAQECPAKTDKKSSKSKQIRRAEPVMVKVASPL